MILVDTSVWIDHLRASEPRLVGLLHRTEVLCHPWVVGELALGQLADREQVLTLLQSLPTVGTVTSSEALLFLSAHRLHGLGIGYVDLQLLASAAVTPGTRLWTKDKRLCGAADRLDLAA
ncbi:MAG: type II toxin-antitoxin system VapC family toxin [Actinomycetota bacterium]|nr:type II toxin-antitoxin system VapC family toxin [Actinomycetota bacterium]